MTDLFLTIVNMSISAGWLVLAVLLLRLLLKRAPRWISVLLWGVVAVRLVSPVSIESILSLIPSAHTIRPDIMLVSAPAIDTGVPIINDTVNPVIGDIFAPAPAVSANPLQIWIPILAAVWLAGVVVMFGYTAVSYWRLHCRVATAVRLRDNIFQSECAGSPFVLGVIRPRIYLPFGIDGRNMAYVVAHEEAHIRRRDHWWKPLGFLLLTVHWFNPLMWLGYILLCRDIELACDERVVAELDAMQRADYSQALLACSVNRRVIAACPLAFGEVGVKNRVRSVLRYKKPALWLIIAAVVVVSAVAVCFLTDPVTSSTRDRLRGVLQNQVTFVTDSGEEHLLKDYITADGNVFVPQQYTWLDFEGDGIEEMVVYGNTSYGTYMIFHPEGDSIWGFELGQRALINLKQDGSFMQSSGAGINNYAHIYFGNHGMQIVEHAYSDDVEKVYRLLGKTVTAQQVQAYMKEFHQKPDAVWIGHSEASNVATGEYNGKTVTVTYTVTALPYPWDMRAIPTVNGYAHLYDYSHYGEYTYAGDTWNALDSRGNLLFEVPYQKLSYFSKEGIAVAQKQNGSYVSVTTTGEETSITEQEFERLYQQHYDGSIPPAEYTSILPAGALERGSNLYRGLTLYVEPSQDDTYFIGVADTDGNVIIPAYIPVRYSPMTEQLYLDEGVAYAEDAVSGMLGKITVTVS